ncbi:uncharacterized protein At4g26485-like [Argentina anserina]|uniref:uncharacterized protein At4g26485-like n=1 Tax=Argentina anserina TaxID=57926 RepID=UPI0021764474|nr:uncharacterized protein At4g26485-like [Potentilla anserina]
MERRIEHYGSSQKILLVGEGDFSFSVCLARAFRRATNMVATSLDSRESLREKHWSCASHLNQLKQRGCLVLHDVDVHDMDQHYILRRMKFDVIIFNFPHAGHYPGLRESHHQLIEMHKQLLSGFFASARVMLRFGGEVHVTARDDYPYNTWDVEELAAEEGLILTERVWFDKSDYPGYHNKRGGGINSNKKFPLRDSYTFKFMINY